MNENPIGVFDSGVGGLSVLIELRKALPDENFVFLADQKYVPYGEKTKEELENLVVRVGKFLLGQGAKIIVVACNTATCYALDALRQNVNVPVVGTVPAIKPAALATKTGVVGLIATPATARSEYVANLIKEHGAGKNVIPIGAYGLEDVVERGSVDSPKVREILIKYLAPIQKAGADQLVLGCTHYPFLRQTIEGIVGPGVSVLDSGSAIAKRTSAILDKDNLRADSGPGRVEYFTTLNPSKFNSSATSLLGEPITSSLAEI